MENTREYGTTREIEILLTLTTVLNSENTQTHQQRRNYYSAHTKGLRLKPA